MLAFSALSPLTVACVEETPAVEVTLSAAHFRVAGRQTWYITPDEIQLDLDVFLRYYNLERSHQGYRLKGRTPAQALREALKRKALPPIVPEPEETTENEAEKLVA